MSIAKSRHAIESRMGWRVKEETFAVIEEEMCMWVAEVETTHAAQNESFFILVQGHSHFIIEKRWRHKLGVWFGHWL